MPESSSTPRVSVLDEMRNAFNFLVTERGYREMASHYAPESFGNAALEYESPALRVRVTRDRSLYEVDYARVTDGDYHFDEVTLHLVGAADDAERLAADRASLSLHAEIIRKHLAGIEEAFAPDRYEATIRELRTLKNQRAEQLWGWRPSGDQDA